MEFATDKGKTHTCLDLAMAASGAKDRKEVGKALILHKLSKLKINWSVL